jgi:hypothetical protein
MDLTKPIDIQAVNDTAKKFSDVLQGIDHLDAALLLSDCTIMPGVQSSLVLGKTERGSISSKYNGVFIGDKQAGTIVPRTLTVYPCVAEMADEPERYRRSFIADVAGGLWDKKHPFEAWLINFGLQTASEDLYNCIYIAKRNDAAEAKSLSDAFDGFYTVLDADIAAARISTAKGNMFSTGIMTGANCGEVLLEMWRSLPQTLRTKVTHMTISEDLGNLYDDWYGLTHDNPPGIDQSGQMFLEGTQKRCVLKRIGSLPANSQRVTITTRANKIYGVDKLNDMKNMRAFNSGNPYLFTAAMKYVFGTQFVSVHPREFVMNDQPTTPL